MPTIWYDPDQPAKGKVIRGIKAGKRRMAVISGSVNHSGIGTKAPIINGENLGKGRIAKLMIGPRMTNHKGTRLTTIQGRVISHSDVNAELVYRRMRDSQIGERDRWYDSSHLLFQKHDFAERPMRVFSGIGTHSVLSETRSVEIKPKQIRKWPQNWHGENMR